MDRKAYILHQWKLGSVVFIVIVIAGFFFMCLTYCLPSERAAMHVRESAAMLDEENLYKELSAGDKTTRQDYFTDIVMLTTAAYGGDENPIDKAINNYRIRKDGASLQEACRNCGKLSGEESEKLEYSRYWHGYVVFLRPLLQFLNLNEIRSLNLFFVILCLCTLTHLLYVRKKGKYIIPLLLAYCVLNPMAISVSLQYSTIFYVTSLSLIVFLRFYGCTTFIKNQWLFFMIIGMATSYFDFLTYPVVVLGFPLIISLAMEEKMTMKSGMKRLVGYSAIWCVGYVGMWASKWGLSSLIMRKNYFVSAIQALQFRSGGEIPSGEASQSVRLMQVLISKFEAIEHNMVIYLAAAFILVCVIGVLVSKGRRQYLPTSFSILLVAIYPVIWYAGTRNHSAIHVFTYRGLSVSVFALTAFLLPLIDVSRLHRREWILKSADEKVR